RPAVSSRLLVGGLVRHHVVEAATFALDGQAGQSVGRPEDRVTASAQVTDHGGSHLGDRPNRRTRYPLYRRVARLWRSQGSGTRLERLPLQPAVGAFEGVQDVVVAGVAGAGVGLGDGHFVVDVGVAVAEAAATGGAGATGLGVAEPAFHGSIPRRSDE